MSKKTSRLESDLDPVVLTVLDTIFDVTQIDPACICPDYRLGTDLGIDAQSIRLIFKNAAQALSLNHDSMASLDHDPSAEQMVELLGAQFRRRTSLNVA